MTSIARPAGAPKNDNYHSYSRQWGDFWRVWWHCLVRLFRAPLGKHRMCELRISRVAIGYGPKWHFCSCGYQWEHVPNDVPMWPYPESRDA